MANGKGRLTVRSAVRHKQPVSALTNHWLIYGLTFVRELACTSESCHLDLFRPLCSLDSINLRCCLSTLSSSFIWNGIHDTTFSNCVIAGMAFGGIRSYASAFANSIYHYRRVACSVTSNFVSYWRAYLNVAWPHLGSHYVPHSWYSSYHPAGCCYAMGRPGIFPMISFPDMQLR